MIDAEWQGSNTKVRIDYAYAREMVPCSR